MAEIRICHGDITTSCANYICHQVNCQGKMNSGVAKAIREKWPRVYEAYMEKINGAASAGDAPFHLGTIQIVALYDDYYKSLRHPCVINMFSQYNYGYDGQRYTSYDAFWNCLHLIKNSAVDKKTIAFPWKIGCVRGGANWNIIKAMIEEVFNEDRFTIEYWKLED